MASEAPENSLMWHLKQVPDARRREGRIYPLGNLLGMLVLAALNGQTNLRQMWLWACKRWGVISRPLGFTGQAKAPAYGTIWYALKRMDVAAMEQETQVWSIEAFGQEESEGWSLDGKVLRGSRREDPKEAALEVVTMAAQGLKRVVGQRTAAQRDDVEAAIQLLKAIPLNGKLVTVDAGLLHADIANTIVEQGGNYLGPLKDNEPGMKEAVDTWIEGQLSPPSQPTSGRLHQRNE
jgi:hypothetical protein